MKEKLTLTIEGKSIAKAKAFAKRQKISVSQMVEQQFQRLDEPPFGEKWRGKFKMPKPDPNDPRLNYLLAKYVRPEQ